jgi:hypothetical protein
MPIKRAVRLCSEKDCKDQQTTKGYCRLHYLKNWKKIRDKEEKKAKKNLDKYVDHLAKKTQDNPKKESLFGSTSSSSSSDNEFLDVLDELDMGSEIDRIIGSIKIDKSF